MNNRLTAAALRRRVLVTGNHGLTCSVSTAAVDAAARVLEHLPDDGEPSVRIDVSATVRQQVIADRLVAMGWVRPMQATMMVQALAAIAGGAMPDANALAQAGNWQEFAVRLQKIAAECLAATNPEEG